MIGIQDKKLISRANLYLPRHGLGTGLLGEQTEKTAICTIQTAFSQGISFFDTAPLYGSGKSEQYLGHALSVVKRSNFLIASKVGRLVQADGSCKFDFSRDGVMRSLEQSLKRLKMDYVDILHIHDPDHHYKQALDEAYPVLAELRAQGVVKVIGVGMNQWQMLRNFAENADFDCFLLAGRYTLLEQTALPFLNLCAARQIAVILGGVFNSGILASDLNQGAHYNYHDAPRDILEKAHKLAASCHDMGLSLKAAALHFPYLHKAVSSVVVGATTPEEVLDNLQNLTIDVPAEFWNTLKIKGLLQEGVPTSR
ncbi:MAG: aldo/keto reductase [Trueperaceae bacterium]|nr:aldo/keto reductase [Trueperaceae bacterium]